MTSEQIILLIVFVLAWVSLFVYIHITFKKILKHLREHNGPKKEAKIIQHPASIKKDTE